MRCLIAGYNLVGALQGRAQNIAPLQVGGIVAVVAIDAIDAIDYYRGLEEGHLAGVGFFGLGGGFGFGLGGGSLFVGWGCELEPVDVVEVDAVKECVEFRVVGCFGLGLFFRGGD